MNVYQVYFKDGRQLLIRCEENLAALHNERKTVDVKKVHLKIKKQHVGFIDLADVSCILDVKAQADAEVMLADEYKEKHPEAKMIKLDK